jgi:hypothetical protein
MLHWWALAGYSWTGCVEYIMKYKFAGGQSSFAINFFEEALASGNLSYVFNTPIASVKDLGASVQVTGRNGITYAASRLISTIPLNILNTVVFDPPLSSGKKAAANIGHVNQVVKVHAEVPGTDLRSWTAASYPTTKFIYEFGDGITPAGNTHLVCFAGQLNHFDPEDSIEQTLQNVRELAPQDPERLVC